MFRKGGDALNIQYVKGVGASRAALLKKLGIETVEDAVRFYPRGYLDFANCTPIRDLEPGETQCVRAFVGCPVSKARIRQGMTIFKTVVADETGTMHVTLFNNPYLAERLQEGKTFLFYGKVAVVHGSFEMTAPLVEDDTDEAAFLPVYPLTAGLSNKQMQKIIRGAMSIWQETANEDLLPDEIRQQNGLCHSLFALQRVHFPKSWEDIAIARRRLIFEELFVLQCGMAALRNQEHIRSEFPMKTEAAADFLESLPFRLTGAQQRAVEDCLCDLRGEDVMNRLVQGDVGSGKTVVAAALLFVAAKNGLQSALMAPTEILARQHYETLQKLFGDRVRVRLLTGGVGAAEKREIRAKLKSGEIDVLVGTHALLTENVAFSSLALVVTDEQHRFGVRQRAALTQKGKAPHVLVMSATPIPRTLSLIIYGDLDVSVIDELPQGRKPIATYSVDSGYHARVYTFVKKLIDQGSQAYIVCPMVEEGESELLAATAYAKTLSEQEFAAYRVGLLHGKMKPKEKTAVMEAFAAGEIQILVATTVIEVGVDVPNAAVMVIENAERFGLSQLHQLRGRVGRGEQQSYCILISDAENDAARERLQVMTKTNDGFKIADADLRLRGPGDFFGSRQHGLPELKIADLLEDMETLRQAKEAAAEVLREDPILTEERHAPLRKAVQTLFSKNGGAALN